MQARTHGIRDKLSVMMLFLGGSVVDLCQRCMMLYKFVGFTCHYLNTFSCCDDTMISDMIINLQGSCHQYLLESVVALSTQPNFTICETNATAEKYM